jgi:diaminohydroxyphosphoribosylaminopyrimidine deaminase/5-amino-6-(5-phosphoribosylamino)uracil reductase
VIVHRGKIIGEGWHQKAGEAHAEVRAVASVKNKDLLKEATLYVSLEPCAHIGKTPPCAALILKHKIPKVVVGCIDPFSEVSGKGIDLMRNAGVEVILGVLEEDCKNSHKRFFTFHTKKRPYIILKWAETQDGFMATLHQQKGKPFWITSQESKKLVHKWRTEEEAILVGTNTAEQDNPELNARLWEGNQPLRIVIDRILKLPNSLKIFNAKAKTLVFTEQNSVGSNTETIQNILFKSVPTEIMQELHKRNIHSVIIEGGQKTLHSFIELNLWDEARVFIGEQRLLKGIAAPILKAKPIKTEKISKDVLNWYKNY